MLVCMGPVQEVAGVAEGIDELEQGAVRVGAHVEFPQHLGTVSYRAHVKRHHRVLRGLRVLETHGVLDGIADDHFASPCGGEWVT